LGFFIGGASLQLQTALMPPVGDALRDKTENKVEDDQKHGHIRPAGTSDLQAQAQTHSPPHYQNSL